VFGRGTNQLLQDANLFHGMALGDAGETVQARLNEERMPLHRHTLDKAGKTSITTAICALTSPTRPLSEATTMLSYARQER
jgi:microcystin-dependent protein